MARPQNPLDVFATYTYHFELHADPSWDTLLALESSDANAHTTRWEPNGTLIINTRKDAHQHIDNVTFAAVASVTSKTELFVSKGKIHMTITEPGGFALTEKLTAVKSNANVKDFSSLQFVLKPIFVGRTPDNTIITIYGKLIPFIISGIRATFDHQGGIYYFEGVIATDMASASRHGPNGPHMQYSYTDKNIQFKANTVEEALSLLSDGLQQNYDKTYTNWLNDNGARKINYSINVDGDIKGKLESVIKDSFAPDDDKKLNFDPKKEIGSHIMDIIRRSKSLNETIGASKDAYDQEFDPGAFMPIIVPRVHMKDGEVEVAYDVKVYKGGGDTFEFDYYFAGAGKNVDILQYEVVFNNLNAWLRTATDMGTDRHSDMSATMATYDTPWWVENIVHPDQTREKLYNLIPKKNTIEALTNDVAYLASSYQQDKFGFNALPVKDVSSSRMATDASVIMRGAIRPQQEVVIRGHLDLFNACCAYPDGSRYMFGTTDSLWIKINIFMVEDGIRRPFFYTGYWMLTGIENHFSGGKFTQKLSMIYKGKG